ncbi:MAG TPA: hypothetical protein VFW00_09430 [Rhodocyclaceae bacterium]|nr:hypothetical protein [Rhodocyclaceae bacterium]
MKVLRYFAILLCLLLTAGTEPPKMLDGPSDPPAGKLRFDGIYQGPPRGYTYWLYLRFFPDGKVTNTSSIGTGTPVYNLLGDDGASIQAGNVTVQGTNISFSTQGSFGTVDFSGVIDRDNLILDSYSHINGNQIKNQTYKFVPIAP